MTHIKISYGKIFTAISALLGLSAFYLPQAHAMGEEGFLECVGNSASSGYPVPQPSPSESAAPAPVTSSSPVTGDPAPVSSTPVTGSPSPVASTPVTGPVGDSVIASQDVSASPVPGPSAAPSTLYGVFVKPERNNQGLLSADIYLLTEQGRWIKQVGHADIDSPSNSGMSGGTSTDPSPDPSGDPSDGTATFQSDPSSPFSFQLTVSQGQASLVQATLFSGDVLSNMTLDCRKGLHHGR